MHNGKKVQQKTIDKKSARTVSVIEGADGPTSVFLVGEKGSKRTLKQNIQRNLFAFRKKCIAAFLKADPHTMEQVIEYAKSKWGYTEVSKKTSKYQTEYIEMRASFLLQYKPELLGELGERPELEGQDEDSIKHFMQLMERRLKAAEAIPTELFDIDMCILEMNKGEFNSRLTFEKNYGYIGGSASGRSQKEMKKYNKVFRDVYKYYGVTQADIDNLTKRYEDVLRTLAIR